MFYLGASRLFSMAALIPATKERLVLWFKNDLRIHDHPILFDIAKGFRQSVASSIPVEKELICIYCFDPRHYGKTIYNSRKTQIFRAKFLQQSVNNLRKNLRSIGSDLFVTCQRPEEFIPKLFSQSCLPTSAVYVSHEVTYEEESIEHQVEQELKKRDIPLRRFEGVNSLYHPSDLPYARPSLGDLPNTFTIFRERVEKECTVRPVLATADRLPATPSEHQLQEENSSIVSSTSSFSFLPNLQQLGFTEEEVRSFESDSHPQSRGVMPFVGGEDAAKTRIEQWMFRDNHLREYFNIRNGMLGEAYSSKLSPWLANGCVSPRFIYSEVKRYEQVKRISNKSTYWLIFELIWRDFFYFFAQKYREKLFFPGGVLGKRNLKWRDDPEMIERWKTGRTGMPLVDANMRELVATGWMSNRGRQNVASYLVYDLHIDWRIGADHFESYLLDYDVCSNYGNWNAAAGLTGGRVNRFNVVKQSNDYDPKGDYIRHWCPELANIPAPAIFEPWKLSKEEQRRYGVKIGNEADADYPLPPDAKTWEGYRYDRETSQAHRKNWGAHYDQPDRAGKTGRTERQRGGRDGKVSSLADFVVKPKK